MVFVVVSYISWLGSREAHNPKTPVKYLPKKKGGPSNVLSLYSEVYEENEKLQSGRKCIQNIQRSPLNSKKTINPNRKGVKDLQRHSTKDT